MKNTTDIHFSESFIKELKEILNLCGCQRVALDFLGGESDTSLIHTQHAYIFRFDENKIEKVVGNSLV